MKTARFDSKILLGNECDDTPVKMEGGNGMGLCFEKKGSRNKIEVLSPGSCQYSEAGLVHSIQSQNDDA